MRLAAAVLALLALSGSPARAASDDAEFVAAFLKIDVPRLPEDQIDRFVGIDAATLPKNLQIPFKARRLELRSLRDVAAAKKKGLWKMSDPNCEIPHDSDATELTVLRRAGYVEITGEEKDWVIARTKCTERDMLCQFTLKELDFKVGKKYRRRYFLFCRASCDPMMVLIGVHRSKVDDSQTQFFGLAGPTCSH